MLAPGSIQNPTAKCLNYITGDTDGSERERRFSFKAGVLGEKLLEGSQCAPALCMSQMRLWQWWGIPF